MENIIQCYYEEIYETPETSLEDRRMRNDVTRYMNLLIESWARGNHRTTNSVAREIVLYIMRYYEDVYVTKKDTAVTRHVHEDDFHNILLVLITLCVKWDVQDSTVVCTLLNHILDCEGKFELIMMGVIVGTSSLRSDRTETQENYLNAIVYFVRHTNLARMEIPHGPEGTLYRFIDLPRKICGLFSPLKLLLYLGLSEQVKTFLRNGAIASTELIEEFLFMGQGFTSVHPVEVVRCVKLLLRVVPKITIRKAIPNCVTTREKLVSLYSNLIENGILPKDRCSFTPPSLKHLSRCAIRTALWKNFSLPDGISELPLPDVLKRYIDILED